jgi:hypothetical protein
MIAHAEKQGAIQQAKQGEQEWHKAFTI